MRSRTVYEAARCRALRLGSRRQLPPRHGGYPAAVQGFTVRPSPLTKETPYIQRSIDATRLAYGLGETKSVNYDAFLPLVRA